jgi:hypothetical protein
MAPLFPKYISQETFFGINVACKKSGIGIGQGSGVVDDARPPYGVMAWMFWKNVSWETFFGNSGL